MQIYLYGLFFLPLIYGFVSEESTEPPPPGSPHRIPIDNNVQNMANKSMDDMNNSVFCEYLMKVVKITDAHAQVVSGILYIIDALVGDTICKKGHPKDDCPLQKEPHLQMCHFKVWRKPWKPDFQQITFNCNKPTFC